MCLKGHSFSPVPVHVCFFQHIFGGFPDLFDSPLFSENSRALVDISLSLLFIHFHFSLLSICTGGATLLLLFVAVVTMASSLKDYAYGDDSEDEALLEPTMTKKRQNALQRRFMCDDFMPRGRLGLLWTLVAVVACFAILSLHSEEGSVMNASSSARTSSHGLMSQQLPDRLQQYGWMDTIEYYRFQLNSASHKMYENEMALRKQYKKGKADNRTDYEKYTADISPLYDVVDDALDTIGVKGIVFDVFFEGLEEYYDLEEDEDCLEASGHGYMCAHYGNWWFYHYTGAIIGDKMIKEGRLLWDGITGEYVDDFFVLQEKIHIRQQLPYIWENSIHVQHGLLWHYASQYMPDMTEFPTQLVYDWCGKWVHEEFPLPSVEGKKIGFACVHGFGHMVFYIAARRQIGADKYPLTARRQIKSMSGLELNHESLCLIRRICIKAEDMASDWKDKGLEYSTDAGNRCTGGAIHSMKLMLEKVPNDPNANKARRKGVQKYFNKEQDECAKEEAKASSKR
jgi:hypothetical protein